MSLHRLIFVAMSLSLAACTTPTGTDQAANAASEKPDPRRGAEVKQICFARNIDGFGATTRTTVVISEGRDDYLVETYNGCFELNHAQSLAVDSFSSCLSRGDDIIASDNVFGSDNIGAPSRPCKIKAIYEWDKDVVAAEAGEDTGNKTSQ